MRKKTRTNETRTNRGWRNTKRNTPKNRADKGEKASGAGGRRDVFGDAPLFFCVFAIALIGVVFVYSASCYTAKKQYNDAFFFVKKQLLGVGVGAIALFACSKFDYKKLQKRGVRLTLYGIGCALLAAVFLPGVGRSNYGATRWIGIGDFTVQPSEIAKFFLVVYCAGYAAQNMGRAATLKGALPMLFAGGIYCALILAEPNMSVTVLVGALTFAMTFVCGVKLKVFLGLALPVLCAVPLLIAAEPYRLLRLSAFLDPWSSPKEEGYQLIQSLYALGNGGFFGTGLFRSRQKYRFLPFAESDFILAIVGEETGFFGIVLLFVLFAFIIARGIKIAAEAQDFFSFLLAFGIVSTFALQVALNALVVSGCVPPTGIPLPLLSAGNTSIVVTMAAFGVLCSIARGNKKAVAFIQ